MSVLLATCDYFFAIFMSHLVLGQLALFGWKGVDVVVLALDELQQQIHALALNVLAENDENGAHGSRFGVCLNLDFVLLLQSACHVPS